MSAKVIWDESLQCNTHPMFKVGLVSVDDELQICLNIGTSATEEHAVILTGFAVFSPLNVQRL